MITIALIVTTVLLAIGLFFSVKKNFLYIEKLDEIDEALQNCSALLQQQYDAVDRKSKLEVFFDDPVVKDLIQDIANSKEAIENVANLLEDMIDTNDLMSNLSNDDLEY